jgi:hypothetical protein
MHPTPYGAMRPSGMPQPLNQAHMGQNSGASVANGGASIAKDFYIYEEDFDSVANGQSGTGNIAIQADSDFVIQKLSYFADIGGAAQTADNRVIPLMTVQLTDTGSGRQLFEEPVSIPALFGTGELPFILPTPKVLPARSTFQVDVANFSDSTTYRLRLSFIGYKLFNQGMG